MRRSRHRRTAPAGAALAMAVAAAPLAAQGNVGRGQGAGRLNEAQMTRMMQGWQPAAREAVRMMPARYGAPMEMTESMAMWGTTEPWKKTVGSAQYGVSASQPAAGALRPTHLRWPPHA